MPETPPSGSLTKPAVAFVPVVMDRSACPTAVGAGLFITLTVPPFVSLPVVWNGTNVNYIAPTNRIGAGSVTIPFQVVDTNVAASSLIVTGAISAYSTNLGSVSFTSTTGIAPNTNNCTLTINATGTGVGGDGGRRGQGQGRRCEGVHLVAAGGGAAARGGLQRPPRRRRQRRRLRCGRPPRRGSSPAGLSLGRPAGRPEAEVVTR